ncbi:hypothetical protein [Cellulophaga sp. Z1A5H]|uniref:hypothetical protein n=1 Tax=Cellulophaga sp. Z1A5H TaxID=2687291 RepID=UPI0013FD5B9D|nr:hypothetical protein [Cellulophaga sp. Z1A5H]
MITRLMVIQKILENGDVEIYQISSDNFQWTFENGRTKVDSDAEYFPFALNGDVSILKRKPGAETKTYLNENGLTFCDDYGVPGGTVIGVLFPENYIPDIIKFKDKPFIPVGFAGQVISRPPGQFEILYNSLSKHCAIIFNMHENICFGFKSISKKVSNENFPNNGNRITDELFDVTLSSEFLNVDSIKTEDLKLINETLNQEDITDVANTLNELLDSLKSGQKEKSKSLLAKVSTLLIGGVSLASGLTKIADSYKHGDSAQQFVGRVIEYISL